MTDKTHWEKVYSSNAPTAVSWYQPEAHLSLELIKRAEPRRDAPIIDIGGGASTLVDGLLDAGYRDVTVLDIAPTALSIAKRRLGDRANVVQWLAADILNADMPHARYMVWHDRAVFHFLTDENDRTRCTQFGSAFTLVDSVKEEHHTPGGRTQAFVYCLCRVET